jgi:hypothetical protein
VKLIVTILALLIVSSSSAQMISVIKAGTTKRVIYHTGDFIHLETANRDISGELFLISDTLLVIGEEVVYVDNIITVIDYSKGRFANNASQKLIAGSIFYFLLTTVNRVGNKNDPVFTDYNTNISLGLIVTGIIVGTFKKRKFKLDKKSRLAILNP